MALSPPLKASLTGVALTLLLAGASLLVVECWHHALYGHFVGYGLHSDVVLGDSDIQKNDTYYARVWNLSLHTVAVEGCRLPGGYAGEGMLYRWDVQRFDIVQRRWNSLRGANNWVPQQFGGYDNEAWPGCRPEVTRIYPLSTRTLAWVYRGWVNGGDAVRMAIHTSTELPANDQPIIYTPVFSIEK
jgi:hypothetical protein